MKDTHVSAERQARDGSTPHSQNASNHELEGVFQQVIKPLQRAITKEGYTTPTPIQEQAIPPVMDGRDVFGCAQTGTGKTAAFTLPILQNLSQQGGRPDSKRPRCLIVTPTRELAAQIGDSIRNYGRFLKLSHTVIFGGVGQNPQVKAMRRGVDIVVATPGRLIDLMGQGEVDLSAVEIFVLDEADRMLDMGFQPDLKKIRHQLPNKRQSLLFSATMPKEVRELAQSLVQNPVEVTITPDEPVVKRIDQRVLFVDERDKQALLSDLLDGGLVDKAIVFTERKHCANKVCRKLNAAGITAVPIHGNKSQSARTRALDGFRRGSTRVLVATDVAARGIDVDGITHVINFNLPNVAETYVHRIGRTARAGTDGMALSFCSAEERGCLHDIEKLLREAVPVDNEHGFHSDSAQNANLSNKPRQGGGGGRRGRGKGGNNGRRRNNNRSRSRSRSRR